MPASSRQLPCARRGSRGKGRGVRPALCACRAVRSGPCPERGSGLASRTVLRRCAIIRMVLSRVSASMACCSLSSFSGSTLAVASSKMMMGASLSMARAMEMRCVLAARERGPALANDGVIAVRQGHDEIVATGFLCRGDHFFMRGLRAAEADVVLYGVREEVHALKDHAHLFHQRFQRVVAHVRAADADRAAVHIPESGDEVAKRRLAAAAGAR